MFYVVSHKYSTSQFLLELMGANHLVFLELTRPQSLFLTSTLYQCICIYWTEPNTGHVLKQILSDSSRTVSFMSPFREKTSHSLFLVSCSGNYIFL